MSLSILPNIRWTFYITPGHRYHRHAAVVFFIIIYYNIVFCYYHYCMTPQRDAFASYRLPTPYIIIVIITHVVIIQHYLIILRYL